MAYYHTVTFDRVYMEIAISICKVWQNNSQCGVEARVYSNQELSCCMVFFQYRWIQSLLGKERTGMNEWMGKYMCDSLVYKLKVIQLHLHHLLQSAVSLNFHSSCEVACLSLTVWAAHLHGMIPLPPLFRSCVCSTSGSVSFVSSSSQMFLLLRWFESSSRIAPCKLKCWR